MRTLLACLLALLAAGGKAADRPNILVILADDLGIGDTGFSGGKDFPTPNIDRIAREGAVFTAGYLTAPVCSPSRAGYLTGRYQQRFGHELNPSEGGQDREGLPMTETLLPARLREAGYRTAIVGKWHLGSGVAFHPLNRGFDEQPLGFLGGSRSYLGKEKSRTRALQSEGKPTETTAYLTDAFGDAGAAFISRRRDKGPWFLYMAFNASHTPLETTPAHMARVPDSVPAARRRLAAMTLALDDNVGKLLAALDAGGQASDTLVVFTSDNGGSTASHASNLGLRGHKGTPFEGGIRTAMALRWPARVKAGSVIAAPTSTLDLAATYLDAATGAVPPGFDGRSLVGALTRGESLDPGRPLFWRSGGRWAVRAGDWKLVCGRKDEGEGGGPITMLVNLRDDPGETTDLSAAQPVKRAELLGLHREWSKGLVPPLWQGLGK